MLNEFLVAFKIQDINILESSDKLKKVKQKILDVIIDEKEECINYLTLPKFKNLSDLSKETLRSVMIDVWNNYQAKTVDEENNKKYSRFFCKSENLKQVE